MVYPTKTSHEKLATNSNFRTSTKFDLLGTTLLGILMWILMGFNTYNADYRAYENLFQQISIFGINSDQNIEIGFRFLMKISSNLSLDYQGFLIVTSFFCILFLILILRKITNNVFFTLFLFFIFGFFSNAVQIRSFISFIIIIFAIYIFLNNDGFRAYLYYTFLILCASFFHITSLFYLILMLIKMNKKVIFIGFLFLLLGILFLRSNLQFYFLDTKFNTYLVSSTGKGIFTNIILLFYFVTNGYLIKRISNMNSSINSDQMQNTLFYINLLVSISFPLVLVNNNFIRLLRNIFIINYSVYSSCLKKNFKETKLKNYILLLTYFMFVLFSAYFFTLRGSSFENGVLSLFKNNIIFNMIAHY